MNYLTLSVSGILQAHTTAEYSTVACKQMQVFGKELDSRVITYSELVEYHNFKHPHNIQT
jgi:hypothetical protein